MVRGHKIETDQFELLNKEVILPMIKYYLVKKYPSLRKDEKFVEIYSSIRDDGRGICVT